MIEYANILLVEDDASLAQWVREYLQEHGFNVAHIARGDEVVEHIKQHEADLVLLDIMLPGMDGIDVCKALRKISNVPIIMMTARADEFDEVVGLEVGANDYVIKPVRPRALLARIKAILRMQETNPVRNLNELMFGKLHINGDSKRVTYQGQNIELSTSLFSLLWLLASNAGTVLDRDAVFKALIGREYDGLDRRMDVLVSNLRKKFNDNPQEPKKFKTIWGKGYLFIADAWDE
ncbi:response regulator transcription factor [Aliiglaciecola sp. LCG003]|uniref:response regulator transcription factor n=1 Tax=Aliiglaciecola sp. LCG003 TaxID=3053655 RepID=UPI00257345D7|nr:response regulator transcription factor [Aliiglaciecola sp. LCG003]WJG09805.1 response regulator transcription factor [Aliiglaciecola sp. LCG003]